MIRYGIGILVATAACAAIGLVACGDDIKDSGGTPIAGTGGASGTGGGGGGGVPSGPPTKCEGACCPTDNTCYSTTDKGVDSPGSECLALRDNTGQDHIQMRQAWIRATTPIGNTDSIVYGVLAGRSELPATACNQGRSALGSGGYIQIIDFFLGGTDKSKHYSTVGYSTFVNAANYQQTLTDGFCNGVDDNYGTQIDAKYALHTADITPDDLAFPPGLPKPMGALEGWKVGPTKAKRIDADFDLAVEGTREKLLKMFDESDPANIKKDGFGGVFYYDDTTGYAHGYGQMGWTVVYGQNGKTHLSIPIREVETRSRFNNKDAPNCVGTFRTDVLQPSGNPPCGSSTATNPAWGGGNCPPDPKAGTTHNCDPAANEAPATTDGYFLITELEQLYSPDLLKTLCVSYPGTVPDPTDATKKVPEVQTEGFYDSTNASCRSATWNPKLAKNAGIPKGDWCAATNKAATADCHDAWKSKSLHVFSAAKIKVGDAANPVATCPFQP